MRYRIFHLFLTHTILVTNVRNIARKTALPIYKLKNDSHNFCNNSKEESKVLKSNKAFPEEQL